MINENDKILSTNVTHPADGTKRKQSHSSSSSAYATCSSSGSDDISCSSSAESNNLLPTQSDQAISSDWISGKSSSDEYQYEIYPINSSEWEAWNAWNKNRIQLKHSMETITHKCCGTNTFDLTESKDHPQSNQQCENGMAQCQLSSDPCSMPYYVPTEQYFEYYGMWYQMWNVFDPYELVENDTVQMSCNVSPRSHPSTTSFDTNKDSSEDSTTFQSVDQNSSSNQSSTTTNSDNSDCSLDTCSALSSSIEQHRSETNVSIFDFRSSEKCPICHSERNSNTSIRVQESFMNEVEIEIISSDEMFKETNCNCSTTDGSVQKKSDVKIYQNDKFNCDDSSVVGSISMADSSGENEDFPCQYCDKSATDEMDDKPTNNHRHSRQETSIRQRRHSSFHNVCLKKLLDNEDECLLVNEEIDIVKIRLQKMILISEKFQTICSRDNCCHCNEFRNRQSKKTDESNESNVLRNCPSSCPVKNDCLQKLLDNEESLLLKNQITFIKNLLQLMIVLLKEFLRICSRLSVKCDCCDYEASRQGYGHCPPLRSIGNQVQGKTFDASDCGKVSKDPSNFDPSKIIVSIRNLDRPSVKYGTDQISTSSKALAGGTNQKPSHSSSSDSDSTYVSCESNDEFHIIPINIDIKVYKRKRASIHSSGSSGKFQSGTQSINSVESEEFDGWNKNHIKADDSFENNFSRKCRSLRTSDKCCGTVSDIIEEKTTTEKCFGSISENDKANETNQSQWSSGMQYVPTQNVFQHCGIWYRELKVFNPHEKAIARDTANQNQMNCNVSHGSLFTNPCVEMNTHFCTEVPSATDVDQSDASDRSLSSQFSRKSGVRSKPVPLPRKWSTSGDENSDCSWFSSTSSSIDPPHQSNISSSSSIIECEQLQNCHSEPNAIEESIHGKSTEKNDMKGTILADESFANDKWSRVDSWEETVDDEDCECAVYATKLINRRQNSNSNLKFNKSNDDPINESAPEIMPNGESLENDDYENDDNNFYCDELLNSIRNTRSFLQSTEIDDEQINHTVPETILHEETLGNDDFDSNALINSQQNDSSPLTFIENEINDTANEIISYEVQTPENGCYDCSQLLQSADEIMSTLAENISDELDVSAMEAYDESAVAPTHEMSCLLTTCSYDVDGNIKKSLYNFQYSNRGCEWKSVAEPEPSFYEQTAQKRSMEDVVIDFSDRYSNMLLLNWANTLSPQPIEQIQYHCMIKSGFEFEPTNYVQEHVDLECDLCALDYAKISACLQRGSFAERATLLDSIYWRLTKNGQNIWQETTQDIVANDMLRLRCKRSLSRSLVNDLLWPLNATYPNALQDSMARLLNALVSTKSGRDYFAYFPIVDSLVWGEKTMGKPCNRFVIEASLAENLMAVMMKLSLNGNQKKYMGRKGLIRWLIKYMENVEQSATTSHHEHMTALLLILVQGEASLAHISGKSVNALSLLIRYLKRPHEEASSYQPYVRVTLIEMFKHAQIAVCARSIFLVDVIRKLQKATNDPAAIKDYLFMRFLLKKPTQTIPRHPMPTIYKTFFSEQEIFSDNHNDPFRWSNNAAAICERLLKSKYCLEEIRTEQSGKEAQQGNQKVTATDRIVGPQKMETQRPRTSSKLAGKNQPAEGFCDQRKTVATIKYPSVSSNQLLLRPKKTSSVAMTTSNNNNCLNKTQSLPLTIGYWPSMVGKRNPMPGCDCLLQQHNVGCSRCPALEVFSIGTKSDVMWPRR